jgi:chromosomal replication initiator protein
MRMDIVVNPRWTFVVTPSNRKAHAAVLTCLKGPPYPHNPLVICGDEGNGRTHLLHALCAGITRSCEHDTVCLTAEELMSRFIAASRSPDNSDLDCRHELTNFAHLFIDDINFLRSKERTTLLLGSVIRVRVAAGRLTVVTSDTPLDRERGFHRALAESASEGVVWSEQGFPALSGPLRFFA